MNPSRLPKVTEWTYKKNEFVFKKGEEMGRFLLGSTVVMLFPKDTLHFNDQWQTAGPVRLG
ncbi:hypothetical protein ASE26_27485 [Duganella sp. Root198D2]|nr:hypothetical protein ASD07_25190 [Duganella sp. Root336D2]KRB93909.1 hypothetical protein ASE26_27485 [Duganella sp. Root198D2]